MNAKRNFTIKFWDPHVFLEQERLGISNSVCRRMPTHTNLWIKMNSDPKWGVTLSNFVTPLLEWANKHFKHGTCIDY